MNKSKDVAAAPLHGIVTPHKCEYVQVYYGHECKTCGDFIADGCEPWNRCGSCGNGDPEGSGEFDPETGEQW